MNLSEIRETADPESQKVSYLLNIIDKVEDLLHPGYWSALDGRREHLLKAVESERREWRTTPKEYEAL